MSENQGPHKAGLFDIRLIIGSLLGVYGVVVLLTGLIGNDTHVQGSKAINIWVGLALVVVSAGFATWTKLRPIVVPEPVEGDDRPAGH